jgi:outer membrane murein-binding lipoprotein Lpp
LLGLWGCTQNAGTNLNNSRIRELEAKTARLEDDCKAAATARDQARKKVHNLEEQRVQLLLQIEQLELVAKERDELRRTLAQRTSERDSLQGHLTQFGRDLQSLAMRIEQTANHVPVSGVPVTVTSRK